VQDAAALGQPAMDAQVEDLEGQKVYLRDLVGKRPIVLEFGSYGCSICVSQAGSMEKLAKKYQGKVEFVLVYCQESHPEGELGEIPRRTRGHKPIPQPRTVAERRQVAQQFREDTGVARQILIDGFGENSAQRLYGAGSASVVVIDSDGLIALKMPTTNSDSLDAFLEKFLAGGGKLDQKLTASVPASGPGEGVAGVEMQAWMLVGMLKDLDLTEAESEAVKSNLQSKLEMRLKLRAQARALEDLSQGKNIMPPDLDRAVKEYEAAVGRYEKAADELDRRLIPRLSARAKARLLAAGVLDNGLGFLQSADRLFTPGGGITPPVPGR
jgi:thiol-disulfide isomerase/thioredoxin